MSLKLFFTSLLIGCLTFGCNLNSRVQYSSKSISASAINIKTPLLVSDVEVQEARVKTETHVQKNGLIKSVDLLLQHALTDFRIKTDSDAAVEPIYKITETMDLYTINFSARPAKFKNIRKIGDAEKKILDKKTESETIKEAK